MPLEVPRSANSNQPRPLPDVDPQWLLMAAAHMQSIGKFQDIDPVKDMIQQGYEQLGGRGKEKPTLPKDLPNPSQPVAPGGQPFPPARPTTTRVRSVG